jgi:hypothetical protein
MAERVGFEPTPSIPTVQNPITFSGNIPYGKRLESGNLYRLCTVVLILLILSGCAAFSGPPPGFDRIGNYNTGQFAADRNEGSIKLNVPEPEDFNPRAKDVPFCVHWVKKCEWHCVDRESW